MKIVMTLTEEEQDILVGIFDSYPEPEYLANVEIHGHGKREQEIFERLFQHIDRAIRCADA